MPSRRIIWRWPEWRKPRRCFIRRRRAAAAAGQSHSGELYNAPQEFREVALGRGHFQVLRRGRNDEGGGIIYGVSDEESRLNVNSATPEELAKLSGMTPDVVAAILDWRDEDNAVSPGGAEAEYYLSLQPPSLPRNGIVPNRSRTADGSRRFAGTAPRARSRVKMDCSAPRATGRTIRRTTRKACRSENAGWSALLTVHSSVRNLKAAG